MRGIFVRTFAKVFFLCALFSVFLFQTPTTDAAINPQLAFYGTLQNTSGANLSGTYDMVFKFYDAPSGGILLDTSVHTASNGNPVAVSSGAFRVDLGSGTGNSLAGIDFTKNTIYVGLTIGSDSEMAPRERLTAVPYAFNSDTLDGYHATDLIRGNASGTISANDTSPLLTITQNGSGDILHLFTGAVSALTVRNNGFVGIGTSSPLHTLSVQGDALITGRLYDSANSAGLSGYVLQSTGGATAWVATSSLGIGGGGTVTSVNLSVPTGLSVSGGPITNSGTLALSLTGGYIIPLTASTSEWVRAYASSSALSASAPLSYNGALGVFSIQQANAIQNGYLTSGDWNTFNSKIATTSIDTSAKLSNILTDETGSGSAVFNASPSFTGTTNLASLIASGSSTISSLTTTNATNTNATSTTLYVSSLARIQNLITTNATATDLSLGGKLFDVSNTAGANGFVLQTTGSGVQWVATSSLGIGGGGGGGTNFFTNSGANTYLTTGTKFGIGTSTPNWDFQVASSATPYLVLSNMSSPYADAKHWFFSNEGDAILRIGQATDDLLATTTGVMIDTWGSNFFVGSQSGTSTGSNNLGLGYFALTGNTSGYNNNALGAFALNKNVDGYDNNALGKYALYLNTRGVGNNALGYQTLRSNTTGSYNSALTEGALYFNTTGQFNNALGFKALYQNISGSNNNAFGQFAMTENTTGSENNAMGILALNYNRTGSGNVAIGGGSLNANYGGDYSTAVGYQALNSSDASYNSALGYRALFNNALGNSNTAIGKNAGYNLTAGNTNIALGENTYFPSTTANGQLVIGNILYGSLPATTTIFQVPTSGSIGIGSTTPTALLSIQANDGDTRTTLFTIGSSTFNSNVSLFTVLNTGRVGIGTTSPTAQLSTTGSVRFATFGAGSLTTDANGNLSVSSDERLKNIDSIFSRGLAAIEGLSPINYRWKPETGFDTANLYTGFSAQNIQQFIPEAVGVNKNGFLSLSDRPILAALVNAIKELAARISALGERTTTKELCLDDVCITKTQLRQLLESKNIAPVSPPPTSSSTPDTASTTPSAPTNATSTPPVGTATPDAVPPPPVPSGDILPTTSPLTGDASTTPTP